MKNLVDGGELHVCWDVDGGGGRFIAEFTFINNKDRKINYILFSFSKAHMLDQIEK